MLSTPLAPPAYGQFFVLEGVDGAGTTTQVARLTARLRTAGRQVYPTREPSEGPIGRLLRQTLAHTEGASPPWQAMALLFAADRLEHLQREILPELEQGSIVLSDRYDASSLAYQSLLSGEKATLPWIRSLNRYARRPDLTLVLDIPPDLASARRGGRGGKPELYEQEALQKKLAPFYRNLSKYMPDDRIAILDGTGTPEEVEARLWHAMQPVLR